MYGSKGRLCANKKSNEFAELYCIFRIIKLKISDNKGTNVTSVLGKENVKYHDILLRHELSPWHELSPATIHADARGINRRRRQFMP